ncbi:DUF3427 domain-containing protein [Hymenobacter sp. ISL-91]|uniref:DUF3427 domain-containing protein n=1 Tax=Hymenobacter sp. ISL-91 TaxID=2819151 RepID=UPI001BEAF8E8|nr:DUF3427 domain-containing protein [Hymenobacter sp. ISL-91]MBT2558142.1 DUF3427 domain-containing protein [Hymenobacter sp. ISL-91]
MPSIPLYTSQVLVPGQVYTRHDLRQLFNISDATINTGVFRPKGSKSIWLFITEEKTAAATPYYDRLEGDMLQWQGQLSGRTDKPIIEHERDGHELLVFFRRSKKEFTASGFRYQGPFHYQSHSGGLPASFILSRLG